jgi:hypothetical protein
MALVPDYFTAFSCKGGDCRNTCCQGWKVSLPMTQYFGLMNLACEPAFQERVARSMRLSLTPTPQSYGEFAHDYRGRCPLLSEDGWCELHAKCGAAALPTVCRQYPRAYRSVFGYEACMVNSCEHTLELLFASNEPLAFHRESMSAALFPKPEQEAPSAEKVTRRAASLAVLSDRSRRLPDRLLALWNGFAGEVSLPPSVPENPLAGDELTKAHRILRTMIEALIQANRSIEELTDQAQSFQSDLDFETTYQEALSRLETTLPDHEIMMEKMLVNHLFYRGFPYLDDPMSETEASEALVGTYSVLRYFTLAVMLVARSVRDFVDAMAKIFRVAAHTHFERRIRGLMRDAEGDTREALRLLCAF